MSATNFKGGLLVDGMPVMGGAPALPFTGNAWYVDAALGNDGYDGTSPQSAFKTLEKAYTVAADGNNDVIFIIGSGKGTKVVTLSAAFTWAKSSLHLVGISPNGGQAVVEIRSGTSCGNNTVMLTVSGSGCQFIGISITPKYTSGIAFGPILNVSGDSNSFVLCDINAFADTQTAASASALGVHIGGSGNIFTRCRIGADLSTQTSRSAANSNVRIAATCGSARFVNCEFTVVGSVDTTRAVKMTEIATKTAMIQFIGCIFSAAGATASAGAFQLASGAITGVLLLKDCTFAKFTAIGVDATTKAQLYIDGAAPTAATSGIAVATA